MEDVSIICLDKPSYIPGYQKLLIQTIFGGESKVKGLDNKPLFMQADRFYICAIGEGIKNQIGFETLEIGDEVIPPMMCVDLKQKIFDPVPMQLVKDPITHATFNVIMYHDIMAWKKTDQKYLKFKNQ